MSQKREPKRLTFRRGFEFGFGGGSPLCEAPTGYNRVISASESSRVIRRPSTHRLEGPAYAFIIRNVDGILFPHWLTGVIICYKEPDRRLLITQSKWRGEGEEFW